MKSKESLKEYLLENHVDGNGNLDLSELDFSDFNGGIIISRMKVKGNLYQDYQKVGNSLYQRSQKVQGELEQYGQTVGGNLFQGLQEVQGSLFQTGNKVKGTIMMGRNLASEVIGCKKNGGSCKKYLLPKWFCEIRSENNE